MRMHMRWFTRLTKAFSKKVENHAAAIALHTIYYNFVRIRQTLKGTPAMAAAEEAVDRAPAQKVPPSSLLLNCAGRPQLRFPTPKIRFPVLH